MQSRMYREKVIGIRLIRWGKGQPGENSATNLERYIPALAIVMANHGGKFIAVGGEKKKEVRT